MKALVIAMVMMVALAIPAIAASITITSKADTEEAATETTSYKAWMLLNASIAEAPTQDGADQSEGKVSYYTTRSAAKAALEGTGLFTFTQVGDEDKWYATPIATYSVDSLISAFEGYTDDQMTAAFGNPYTGAQSTPGGNATITCGDDGYYFVKSTLGDQIAVQTIGDVTIETKNSYPTQEKELKEATDADVQIGDEVTYTLTVNIPATANDVIVLTDVMDEGLTFVSIDDTFSSSVAYTFAPEKTASAVTANNNTFTLTIDKDTVKAHQGETLTIDYIAVVNNKAEVAVPEKNTVTLDYGNNYTSVPKDVEVVTHKFTFDKIDGDDQTPLTGAEFELQLDGTALALVVLTEGEAYRIATDEDTDTVTTIVTAGKTITINGVDSDVTYSLVETKEPAGGYNKLENPETITVTADDQAHYDIENNKGSVLPSTGGIGTTIFYVIGAILVLGAGIVLISRRRMSSK